jgi:choline dehydrogenase-like flavoprotein
LFILSFFDEKQGKATGVRVIDAQTKETTKYYANIVFLCASTLPSAQIMLNSTSASFPNGIGNSSGMLGHHLMDHYFVSVKGKIDGFEDGYYNGHRPNGIYVPRFENVDTKNPDFLRGFGFQGSARREGWSRGTQMEGFGAAFKEEISKPGPWTMALEAYGECLPYFDNKVELHPELKDQWGIPILHISCELKENEHKILKASSKIGVEMMEKAGFKDITPGDPKEWIFGDGIHEMGTARMGRDPKTSVLNQWNACHDVPNLFVTDGSFMTSSGCQNPSLTYMAFTARAANYAVDEMKKGNL